jgi:hypothetical protein
MIPAHGIDVVPPLYVCLRTLSRRRAHTRLFPEYDFHRAVRLPESFRGGCSFGAGRGRSLPLR